MPNISKEQTITEFVKSDFKDFSIENTRRMVPSVIDGLKRSQRKAVWAMAEMGNMETVERLGLKAAALTAYKHGGSNMCGTIIKLAQDFPGTNNFPLILKDGQFGSAIDHDNSSARYIEAIIHPNYRMMFKKEDDDILEHQLDQGKKIEPYYLFPVIPMVLVNGGRAVGSGYGTNFPSHNILDVLKAVMETLEHDYPQTRLVPNYNGYQGTVIRKESEQFEIRGAITIKNTTTIKITAVTPNLSKEDFKVKQLIPKLEAKEIVDYIDNSNETDGWDIEIKFTREALAGHTEESLIEMFGLIVRDTPNYTLWNFDGQIEKYKKPEDIVELFVAWRLERNADRKVSLLAKLQAELDYWKQYTKFLTDYLDNTDDYKAMTRAVMLEHVMNLGIEKMNAEKFIKTPAYNLNIEGINKATEMMKKLNEEYKTLDKKSPKMLYIEDLLELSEYVEGQNND